MKCNEIYELMPDLAAGLTTPTPVVSEHLHACGECAGKLDELRKTMALLDEWHTPEPSPYFDTRLQARLREEKAGQSVGWWQWVRKPAMAISLAAVVVVSVTVFRGRGGENHTASVTPATVSAPADPGTAVGDLQALDGNHDLLSDFDELDDLQVQSDVTANP